MIKTKHEEDGYNLSEQMDKFEKKTGNSFQKFYNKYLPKLIYHNNKYLKDEAVSEDIATDSILKSLKKIDDYDPEKAGYSTWLFTISKNECIQYLNKANKLISVDKFVDEEGTTIKDFLEDKFDEDQYMKDIEKLNIKKGKMLKEKISDLKNPYKKVIKLREIDKKSYREITIILRKNQIVDVDESCFKGFLFLNNENFPKLFNIEIRDNDGKKVKFKVVEKDKEDMVSAISIPEGDYTMFANTKEGGEMKEYKIKKRYFNGKLLLVDPEKKKKSEVFKFYTLSSITTKTGENVEFEILERDKDGLISKIEIPRGKGNYIFEGEVPFNMSTLKSQIRNGRINLKTMVEKEFKTLDKMYL